MVEAHFLLENLWISEPALGILEKSQRSSDLPNIKYSCVLLFLNQLYWYLFTNAKMWKEIADIVVLGKKLLKFLQGARGNYFGFIPYIICTFSLV